MWLLPPVQLRRESPTGIRHQDPRLPGGHSREAQMRPKGQERSTWYPGDRAAHQPRQPGSTGTLRTRPPVLHRGLSGSIHRAWPPGAQVALAGAGPCSRSCCVGEPLVLGLRGRR